MKTKQHTPARRKFLSGGLMLAFATLTTACGGFKTDPTKGYEDLKPYGPKTQTVTRKQIDCSFVFPPPAYDVPNFVAGQSSEFQVNAAVTLEGVQYRVNPVGLPAWMKFTQGTSAGSYVLTGTPPQDLFPRGSRPARTEKFKIQLEILSGDASGCAAPVNGKTYDIQYVVMKSGEIPAIVTATAKSESVVQGEMVALVVEGSDAMATKDHPPILVPDNEDGGMNVVKGKDAVSFGKGTLAEGGVFRFEGKFDSSKITIPAGKSEVTARFIVRLIGQDKVESAGKTIDIKVLAKSKAEPKPAAPKTEVKAGDKK